KWKTKISWPTPHAAPPANSSAATKRLSSPASARSLSSESVRPRMTLPGLGQYRWPDPKATRARLGLLLAATVVAGWVGCGHAAENSPVAARPTDTGIRAAGIAAERPEATPRPPLLAGKSATTNFDRFPAASASGPGQAVFIAQVALSRRGISSGSID